MEDEIWKDTHVLGEFYQVSNLGNVRSKDRYVNAPRGLKRFIRGRALNPYTTQHGYKMVVLSRNMEQHNIFVHRLVAYAFVENPGNKPICNHIDSNKQNNCASNIEWCNKLENWNHAYAAGAVPKRNGEKSGANKISENTAREIKVLLSQGFKPAAICQKVCVAKHIVHAISYGFSWKHVTIS